MQPTDAMAETLYDDLKKIARRERFQAGSPLTLQTTAVIHEAYLKLYRKNGDWQSREHFLAVAATAMRHVLVDAARARLAAKRGSGVRPEAIAEDVGGARGEDLDIIRLGEALQGLANLDPGLAKIVDCRFFAGLDERETGQIMAISERTVRRRWAQARAWIHRELSGP